MEFIDAIIWIVLKNWGKQNAYKHFDSMLKHEHVHDKDCEYTKKVGLNEDNG